MNGFGAFFESVIPSGSGNSPKDEAKQPLLSAMAVVPMEDPILVAIRHAETLLSSGNLDPKAHFATNVRKELLVKGGGKDKQKVIDQIERLYDAKFSGVSSNSRSSSPSASSYSPPSPTTL